MDHQFALSNVHREITPLTPEDSFIVFDRFKEDFDFPIHFHPEYELNCIINGKGVRRVVGDNLEEIDDIELVLVGPNLIHGWETHNSKNKLIHEITIQFHEDLLDAKLLSRTIFKPLRDLFHRANHGILFSRKISEECLPKIMRLSKTTNIDYFLDLMSILHDLANSRNQRLLSTSVSQLNDFENSKKIKKVYDYVQENYDRKVSLDEISELVNMTVVTFNRFIKKRTGKTFVEYINDTRISYASRWLIETDLTISEIGFKCGFNNMANFNRVFKKVKGITPSIFRAEFNGIRRVL